MSICLTWGNAEKTYLIYTFDGPWSVKELYAALDESSAMVESVTFSVDMLVDVRLSGKVSGNIATIAGRMQRNPKSPVGMTYIVGANPYFKALGETFQHLHGGLMSRIVFVDSMEEALTRIQAGDHQRSSPPRLPPE